MCQEESYRSNESFHQWNWWC